MSYALSLAALQSAMLNNEPHAVSDLLDHDRPDYNARLNVYIEGYRTRLIDVVISDYPTLTYYLGENEMKKYCRAYIEATPSSFYSLDSYPVAFASFLDEHSNNRLAITIAVLESAIAEVFWMKDSPAFIPPAALDEVQLMDLRLTTRKASKMLTLTHPVDDYLLTVRQGDIPEVPKENLTHMVVVRHFNEVKRHTISVMENDALIELSRGSSIGEMLEILSERYNDRLDEISNSLPGWLSKWITEGFFRQPSSAN